MSQYSLTYWCWNFLSLLNYCDCYSILSVTRLHDSTMSCEIECAQCTYSHTQFTYHWCTVLKRCTVVIRPVTATEADKHCTLGFHECSNSIDSQVCVWTTMVLLWAMAVYNYKGLIRIVLVMMWPGELRSVAMTSGVPSVIRQAHNTGGWRTLRSCADSWASVELSTPSIEIRKPLESGNSISSLQWYVTFCSLACRIVQGLMIALCQFTITVSGALDMRTTLKIAHWLCTQTLGSVPMTWMWPSLAGRPQKVSWGITGTSDSGYNSHCNRVDLAFM